MPSNRPLARFFQDESEPCTPQEYILSVKRLSSKRNGATLPLPRTQQKAKLEQLARLLTQEHHQRLPGTPATEISMPTLLLSLTGEIALERKELCYTGILSSLDVSSMEQKKQHNKV